MSWEAKVEKTIEDPNKESPIIEKRSSENEDQDQNKKQKLEIPKGMSKTQWKKQQKRLYWESRKDEIRKYKKEKKNQLKKERQEIIDSRLAKGESIEKIKEDLNLNNKNRNNTPRINPDQIDSNIKIIFDCGFDDKMNERERSSLSTQLSRAYSENRRTAKYTPIKVTSFSGKLKERFDTKIESHKLWKNIEFIQEDLDVLIEHNQLDINKTVYLSADEHENVCEELTEEMTYIIGGIVDKGRYKNLCYDKAKKLGIKTARLPIDEYFKISGRKVLTSLHVFMILLNWIEAKNWKNAFESILPVRKRADGTKEMDDEEKDEELDETVENNK